MAQETEAQSLRAKSDLHYDIQAATLFLFSGVAEWSGPSQLKPFNG